MGKRHGHGHLAWLDGSTYVGQFVEGVRSGQGTLALPVDPGGGKPLGQYTGQWRDSSMHGRGTYESSQEGRYKGQFRHNSFHGHGQQQFPSGDSYEGSFVRGRREGKGRY